MKRVFLPVLVLTWVGAASCKGDETMPVLEPAEEPPAATILGQVPTVHNRQVEALPEGGVRLSEAEGDGLAYLPDVSFSNGTIEFDVRGRNLPQRSFVGLAFHGVDAETYDAVYFRPFNFHAEEADRRSRSVQYVSHPDYPWFRLREEQPGTYEGSLESPPGADDWFHVRIIVETPQVQVFVGDSAEPSLVVEQLSDRGRGWVGFWVGNGSNGDFANLKLTPAS